MKRVLTFACGRSDRTKALFDGSVRAAGLDLAMLALPPSEIFPRALTRAEFDVCELSASSYVVQLSRGESQYVALPVFLSRSFRLDAIYVRDDRDISCPADLGGRKLGTPEFQMTAGLWARGILKDRYGLDPRSMAWTTGGLNASGRKERIPITPGPGYRITPAPEGRSLNDLLQEGVLDGVIAPEPPSCFRNADAGVRRLFADPRAEEKAYFEQSGIFPIMHLVAVRRSVLESRPDIAVALYEALVAARDDGYRRLEAMAAAPSLPIMLPFLAAEIAETRRIMGADHWPYGVAANSATIEALCRHSADQGLSARPVSPDELFFETLRST